MNKKTLLFVAPVCLAVLAFVIWKAFPRPAAPAETARGDVGKNLQARVAALPKPALTNLPRLAPAAPRVGARSSPAAALVRARCCRCRAVWVGVTVIMMGSVSRNLACSQSPEQGEPVRALVPERSAEMTEYGEKYIR